MNPHLERLFDHLAWADDRVLGALEQAPATSARTLKLLAHLLSAERIWMLRLQNEDTGKEIVWPDLTLVQCRAMAEASRTGYREILRTATEARLAALVSYRTTKGDPMTTSMADILFHVALHGAYHRGQIAALLRGEGLEPANTDFIMFSRIGG